MAVKVRKKRMKTVRQTAREAALWWRAKRPLRGHLRRLLTKLGFHLRGIDSPSCRDTRIGKMKAPAERFLGIRLGLQPRSRPREYSGRV